MRDLPPLTVRLPLPVLARLKGLCAMRGVSASALIEEGLKMLFDTVPVEDVRTLGSNARLIVERLRVQYPNGE